MMYTCGTPGKRPAAFLLMTYLYETRVLEVAVIKSTSGRKCGTRNEGGFKAYQVVQCLPRRTSPSNYGCLRTEENFSLNLYVLLSKQQLIVRIKTYYLALLLNKWN